MIRPVRFGYNEQTAASNAFQDLKLKGLEVQEQALREFEDFQRLLEDNGIQVMVIEDTPEPYTPDSIFPNNWISTHSDGSIFLFPMAAANRRDERRQDIVDLLRERYYIKEIVDLTAFEDEGRFLEGTGSMVLDRENKITYACISPRTDEFVLKKFAEKSGYRHVCFHSADSKGRAIYHTNVMMSVGTGFALVCLDSIASEEERNLLTSTLLLTDKEIIKLSLEQIRHFAGNMLELRNNRGEKLLVMSDQAFESLAPEQIKRLEKYCRIVHSPLTTIESTGGGSARCMIAEIHLPLP